MADAPIVLIALDIPHEGNISARCASDPRFTHVQDLADAMHAAMARGVDLVIPHQLYVELSADLPPTLPAWIKIE